MTPSFALLLDQDGISLLHRTGSSWHSLGAVSVEAPDLGEALADLRARALTLNDGAPLRCALVLPNSQILYTDAETGRDARENAARAARCLDGATPYMLEELVFDWRTRGDEIRIAAVARETLEEAEGFAALHGFGPICFTASPEPGIFPGAPFFGPTDAAPRLLAPGEVLERMSRPILPAPPQAAPEIPAPTASETVESAAQDMPAPAPMPEEIAPAEAEQAPDTAAPEATLSELSESGTAPEEGSAEDILDGLDPAEAPAADSADAAEETTDHVLPDQPETSTEADAEETLSEPVAFRRADLDAPLPETPPELVASDEPDPDEAEAQAVPQPPHAPVIFRRADLEQEDPEEVANANPEDGLEASGVSDASRQLPHVPEEEDADHALFAFASIRPETDPEIPRDADAADANLADAPPPEAPAPASMRREESTGADKPAGNGRKGARKRKEPPLAATAATAADAAEAPAGTALSSALSAADAAIFAAPDPTDAPPPSTTSAPAGLRREAAGLFAPERQQALSEADALTVFGARKSQKQPGGSISAGLIAAVAGVAAIGLVTLWAFVGNAPEDTGIAGLTPPEGLIIEPPRAPNVVTSQLPEETIAIAPAAETAPDPAAPDAPQKAVAAVDTPPESSAPEAADALAGALGTKAPTVDTATLVPDETAETGRSATDYGAEMQLATLSTADGAGDAATGAPAARLEADGAPQVAEPADGVASTAPPAPLDAISARAAYAVSGIWQRAPERGYTPARDGLEDFYIASIDPKISNHDAFSLPRLDLRPDTLPPVAAIPVIPVPQDAPEATGADSANLPPGGVEIRLGRPDIVPPRRPEDLAPQATAPAESDPKPESATAVDEQLRGKRPRLRPQGLIEDNERASLGGRTRNELGLLRPATRPASVQETASALTDAAQMADAETPEGQNDETVADRSALDADLATATARAIARSPEPRLRPANIAQIADRARQRAAREAQLQAEAEQKLREEAETAALARARAEASAARNAAEAEKTAQKQAAALAATKAAEAKQQQEAAARAAKEAEAEAEAKAAAARGPAVPRSERVRPSTTTPAAVARQATEKNALRLSRVSLIGVYGTSNQRRALVRLPSGKYVKVKVGDRIDGGRVAAIGQSDLRYQKSGRTVTLKMPKG